MKFIRNLTGAVLALVALAPASASACWLPRAAEAAQLRAFETMLMVSTLRCQKSQTEMVDDYNQFVRVSRATLISANNTLRTHFSQNRNGRSPINAFDGYVTSIANSYGSGVAGLSCSDLQAIIQEAAGAKGSRDTLMDIAQRLAVQPVLPGGRCVMTARATSHP